LLIINTSGEPYAKPKGRERQWKSKRLSLTCEMSGLNNK
jgi:hypothetical protein